MNCGGEFVDEMCRSFPLHVPVFPTRSRNDLREACGVPTQGDCPQDMARGDAASSRGHAECPSANRLLKRCGDPRSSRAAHVGPTKRRGRPLRADPSLPLENSRETTAPCQPPSTRQARPPESSGNGGHEHPSRRRSRSRSPPQHRASKARPHRSVRRTCPYPCPSC